MRSGTRGRSPAKHRCRRAGRRRARRVGNAGRRGTQTHRNPKLSKAERASAKAYTDPANARLAPRARREQAEGWRDQSARFVRAFWRPVAEHPGPRLGGTRAVTRTSKQPRQSARGTNPFGVSPWVASRRRGRQSAAVWRTALTCWRRCDAKLSHAATEPNTPARRLRRWRAAAR